MGYAVCHQDVTGTQRIEDVASLAAAVEVVERLRNGDGVSDVRVFREVPIEVRTYYKVSIAEDEVPATSTPVPAVEDSPAPAPTSSVPAIDPSVEVVTAAATPAADETVSVVTTASAAGDPPPGAFPLASTPLPAPAVEVHDAEHDTASDASRRHSLFSRGG